MPIPPDWAARFIGIHYLPGGRDYDGADCWGYIRLVARDQFGIELPLFEGVYFEPSKDPRVNVVRARQIAEFMGNHRDVTWEPVPDGSERPGDGILLRSNAQPIHCGIVAVPGLMLHCESGRDSAFGDYTSMEWRTRIVGFFRAKTI